MSDEELLQAAEPEQGEESELKTETVETPPEPTPGQDDAEKADREKRGAQKRIDRLTREKYELRAKAEYLEKMLQSQGAQPVREAADKPQREQFENDAEYLDALVEQRLAERDRRAAEEQAKRDREASASKVHKIYEAAQSENEDFDAEEFIQDVASKMSAEMADAIVDSDISHKLVLYFNDNLDEVKRIGKLSPARQAAEIGKIEVKLSNPAPVKKSAAPEPIKGVVGKGSVTSGLSDEIPVDEWLRRRNKQLVDR